MSALLDRFNSGHPKKILSLDGGGIRGALTLGYLKKLEDILKEKFHDQPDFRLCDYFDLIGGTSTGSIIAASLAIGKTVDEITKLYMDLGGKIFGEKRNWWNPMETMKWLKANYNYKAMEDGLRLAFGDIKLGGEELKTGLCIVAKRADTNSVWPLINHPKGKFYNTHHDKNKDIPLWQAVRASSAAPTYFAPQMIEVQQGQQAAFIDGGLSMANNPALTLLMIATLKGFPFHWEMSEEKLMLVSIGTGYTLYKKYVKEIDDSTMLSWAANIPDMLMQDASWQNRVLLQWLSQSPTADYLDMEIEKMDGDLLAGKPLISYLRYNFCITEQDLNGLGLNRKFTAADVKSLTDMSIAENRQLLYQIGERASVSIRPEHFNNH
ncbi:MAG: patatin-like phospholipase family protein [Ginsengibacter sp.]